MIAATAALMGSCVFLPDQEGRRFRYFGEHAVPYRAVWLAKLLTWTSVLCVWAVVVHGLWFLLQGGPNFLTRPANRSTGALGRLGQSLLRDVVQAFAAHCPVAVQTIGGFACGQLGSMFLRSGILAASVGLVSTLALYGWAELMQFLEIGWLWSLCPIPLVLLFATWLRTPDWILERNTWRGWLRIAAVLTSAFAASSCRSGFLPRQRDSKRSPGFLARRIARSIGPTEAAKQTADMFLRAAYLLTEDRQVADFDSQRRHRRPVMPLTFAPTAKHLTWP